MASLSIYLKALRTPLRPVQQIE